MATRDPNELALVSASRRRRAESRASCRVQTTFPGPFPQRMPGSELERKQPGVVDLVGAVRESSLGVWLMPAG